ncbi:MAG: putative sporulation protein YtxC [Veillonellales bacterium]
MKLLSVGLTGTTDDIRARLQQDCISLKQEGFRVAIDEINKGNYTFLGCNVIEGELSFRNYERIKNLLKTYVAKILAELIILREEKKIVKKIIEHNYYYFSADEQNIVYDNTLKNLNSNNEVFSDFGRTTRHNTILTKIVDYLDNHHELVLDGFINFRLKEYRERLVEIVDSAVDDLMMDLEYKEFIRVLRYFVDIQEPQVEEVHVLLNDNGNFRILDIEGKAINNQQFVDFLNESEINPEDLLITALITISPYNIMIHSTNPSTVQNVIETIKSIFEGRVAVCEGCPICRKK